MNVSICDDEDLFLDKISQDLKRIAQDLELNISMALYQSGKEFLEGYIDNPDVDIVFMDILLGNENGYKIASKIRESNQKVKIIFLTSITKYAIKGYEIGATRYLVKPVSFELLKSVFLKTIEEIRISNAEYIIEKNDDGIYKIFLSDIVYIETYGRNTIIHTKEKSIISYKTIKKHLSSLNSKFMRCHAGIIVNLEYVVELRRNSLGMQYGQEVPMSKSRKNEIKEALMKYFDNMIENR